MTHRNTTLDALNELAQAHDWLIANLRPGTSKPYQAPQMSDEKRRELDRQNRDARQIVDYGRGVLLPLGESPAPLDLDIMDLLVDILDLVAAHSGQREPRSCFDDPRPHFTAIRRQLLAGRMTTHHQTDLEHGCEGLVYRAHQQLGLFGDGQLLAATCPWCQGRTATNPTGGDRTMRVRAKLPPGKKNLTGVDPTDIRWYVVCESGTCEPPDQDCGERHRGRPAWPLGAEGDWLAQRIEANAS